MSINSDAFSDDYATMGHMSELELMIRGSIEPPSYPHTAHLSRDERLNQVIKDREPRLLINLKFAASTFEDFRGADNDELKWARRRYQQALDRVPNDLNEQIFDFWRSYLQDALGAIDDLLSDRGIQPAGKEADQVRDYIRKTIETITKLEQDCEEEVRKNPDQEHVIRKIYRQSIDRIRDQQ